MASVMVLKFAEDAHLSNAQKILRELQENTDLKLDQGWMAIDGDAEMVLDVFKPGELGGGRHVADIDNPEDDVPSWVIEHSLVCRRSGQMSKCPWIARVSLAANDSDLPSTGRWVLSLSEIDGEIAFWPEDPTKVTD